MNIDVTALKAVEREKGIPADTVIEAIETALVTAYRHADGAAKHVRVHVDRKSGEMEEYATGLFAATDLAISPVGTVYVSELFGGQISKIVDGEPVTVAEVPLPAAVEWHRGMLYAAIDVFPGEQGPDGKVVTIQP